MRRLYILILLFLFSLQSIVAQPKHEVRAVWLTTIGGLDWPHSYAQSTASAERQKKELRDILDRLQAIGVNTVLLQTRIRGTVIYPSAREPWDGCLSGFPGKSPGYDALQYAIDECHRRGMELHAWIVTIPVGKWDALGCRQLRKKMPGNLIKIKADGYMNPETQQTANYIADLCEEVVRAYDVDGIHLDYIRYPEELPKLKTMSRQAGRNNITRIVRLTSQCVKRIKPWVKMSCSPIGKYDDTARYWSNGWNARTAVCQDAAEWLREGLMDELFPMMYFRDNHFYPFVLDWKERSNGRIVVPGLGIYFLSPREKNWPLTDITRELHVLRSLGMGHAYFRSKFLTDNVKGLYDFLHNDYCHYPSLVPPMTWQSAALPVAPTTLMRQDLVNGKQMLTWQHANADTTMMLFNVYASATYPVDTRDARNLLLIRRQQRSLLLPYEGGRYYAITAIDRYGNESPALQEAAPKGASATDCFAYTQPLLVCRDGWLAVPQAVALSNAEYFAVETLQGSMVLTLPYRQHTSRIDLGGLPDGMYALRTLDRKGNSHRVCLFMKRVK